MNDRCGSFYEPPQNPAYRFTLARELSSPTSDNAEASVFLDFRTFLTPALLLLMSSERRNFGAQFYQCESPISAE
jgi:hypothetical protein